MVQEVSVDALEEDWKQLTASLLSYQPTQVELDEKIASTVSNHPVAKGPSGNSEFSLSMMSPLADSPSSGNKQMYTPKPLVPSVTHSSMKESRRLSLSDFSASSFSNKTQSVLKQVLQQRSAMYKFTEKHASYPVPELGQETGAVAKRTAAGGDEKKVAPLKYRTIRRIHYNPTKGATKNKEKEFHSNFTRLGELEDMHAQCTMVIHSKTQATDYPHLFRAHHPKVEPKFKSAAQQAKELEERKKRENRAFQSAAVKVKVTPRELRGKRNDGNHSLGRDKSANTIVHHSDALATVPGIARSELFDEDSLYRQPVN